MGHTLPYKKQCSVLGTQNPVLRRFLVALIALPYCPVSSVIMLRKLLYVPLVQIDDVLGNLFVSFFTPLVSNQKYHVKTRKDCALKLNILRQNRIEYQMG